MNKINIHSKKIIKQSIPKQSDKKHMFGLMAYCDKEFGWMKNEVLCRGEKSLLQMAVQFYRYKQPAVACSIAKRHNIPWETCYDMVGNQVMSKDVFGPITQVLD